MKINELNCELEQSVSGKNCRLLPIITLLLKKHHFLNRELTPARAECGYDTRAAVDIGIMLSHLVKEMDIVSSCLLASKIYYH